MVRLIRSGQLSGVEMLNMSLGALHRRTAATRDDALRLKQMELAANESKLRHMNEIRRMQMENERLAYDVAFKTQGMEVELRNSNLGMIKEYSNLAYLSAEQAAEADTKRSQELVNLTSRLWFAEGQDEKGRHVPGYFLNENLNKLYKAAVDASPKGSIPNGGSMAYNIANDYAQLTKTYRDRGENPIQASNLAMQQALDNIVVGLARYVADDKSTVLNAALERIGNAEPGTRDMDIVKGTLMARAGEFIFDPDNITGEVMDMTKMMANDLLNPVTGIEYSGRNWYDADMAWEHATKTRDSYRGKVIGLTTNLDRMSEGKPLLSPDELAAYIAASDTSKDISDIAADIKVSSEQTEKDGNAHPENPYALDPDEELGGSIFANARAPRDGPESRPMVAYDKDTGWHTKASLDMGTSWDSTNPINNAIGIGLEAIGTGATKGAQGITKGITTGIQKLFGTYEAPFKPPEQRAPNYGTLNFLSSEASMIATPERQGGYPQTRDQRFQVGPSIGGSPGSGVRATPDMLEQQIRAKQEQQPQQMSKIDLMRAAEFANEDAGFEEGYLTKLAFIESDFVPTAVNPHKDSSATGMYQMVDSTATSLGYNIDKESPTYRKEGDERMDPMLMIERTVQLTQDHIRSLKSRGLPATGLNKYIMHQQGDPNGPNLLSVAEGDSTFNAKQRHRVIINIPESQREAAKKLDDTDLARLWVSIYSRRWQRAGKQRDELVKTSRDILGGQRSVGY